MYNDFQKVIATITWIIFVFTNLWFNLIDFTAHADYIYPNTLSLTSSKGSFTGTSSFSWTSNNFINGSWSRDFSFDFNADRSSSWSAIKSWPNLSVSEQSSAVTTINNWDIYIFGWYNSQSWYTNNIQKIDMLDNVSDLSLPDFSLSNPQRLRIDSNDTLYVTNKNKNTVVKIPTSWPSSIYRTGDQPVWVTIDWSWNIYTSNFWANTITKINQSWSNSYWTIWSTPLEITNDWSWNVFTSNSASWSVTKIDSSWNSSIIWQSTATGTNLSWIVIDSLWQLYISDKETNSIIKLTLSGSSYSASDFRNLSFWAQPTRITIDWNWNIYTSNNWTNNVTKITPEGVKSSFWTTGNHPFWITIDWNWNIYTSNNWANNVTKITPFWQSSVLWLTGTNPLWIVVDSHWNVYTADYWSDTITKITPTGISSIVWKQTIPTWIQGWNSIIYNNSLYLVWWETSSWKINTISKIQENPFSSQILDLTGSTFRLSENRWFWGSVINNSSIISFWWSKDSSWSEGIISNNTDIIDINSWQRTSWNLMIYWVSNFSYALTWSWKIYVVWWYDWSNTISATQIYDIWTNTWSTGSDLPSWIRNATMQEINWNLYLFWGTDSNWNITNSIYIYNIEKDNWIKSNTNLQTFRKNLFSTKRIDSNWQEVIYLIWWENSNWNTLNSTEIYNPKKEKYTNVHLWIINKDLNLSYSWSITNQYSTGDIYIEQVNNWTWSLFWSYSWSFTYISSLWFNVDTLSIQSNNSIPDWQYEISLNAWQDDIFYKFIKDSIIPIIISTWSINNNITWTWLDIQNIIIQEKYLSWSYLEYTENSNTWYRYSSKIQLSGSWDLSTNTFTGQVNIWNLIENTNYKYRIFAIDKSWNSIVSDDFSFSTPDKTPPLIVETPYLVSSRSETSASISQKISKDWTWYYIFLPESESGSAPNIQTLTNSWTSFPMISNTWSIVDLTWLTANTQYIYYFIAQDSFGNTQTWMTIYPFKTADLTPPETILSPEIIWNPTWTGVVIKQQINESWTWYYLVLPKEDNKPSGSELISSWSSFSMSWNTDIPVNITWLNSQTSYKYYFVAKDISWNVQPSVSTWLIFTTADITPPVTTSAPAISTAASWTTVSIAQTINETGTGYYYILPSESSKPSFENLTESWIEFPMTASSSVVVDITELTYWTSYKYYFIAKDLSWNIQNTISDWLLFTTTSTWTFDLNNNSLFVSQNTDITDNCSISPTQYFSSNTWVVTISSWKTINAIWSWTSIITPIDWICKDSSWKTLTVSDLVGTFTLWTGSLLTSQTTSISSDCSIQPTSYSSSDTWVATISWTTITTVWSWTSVITSTWGLCLDSTWKILNVSNPIWEITLWTWNLIRTQTTSISSDCSISPYSYISSNTWVATVSWSMITAVWSWTAVITPNWGLCWNNPWKIINVSELIWTFNLRTWSLLTTQQTSISDNCSIPPNSYISSNTSVATISGSLITSIWSGTTSITASWGLCLSLTWKILNVSNPNWEISLWTGSLIRTQTTSISNNCSIPPTTYISSNTNAVTVSWSVITAVWSWTSVITASGGLCWNNSWKTISVSELVWTFNIWTGSLLSSQTTSLSTNCSISPTSFTSSNTGVATISWSIISAIWSWTTTITANGGLCLSYTWKTLTVSNPIWTFSLWSWNLIKTQTTSISSNCSILPTSYNSSNTWVATISWSIITTIWSWTTVITQNWWLCGDSTGKVLTVSELVWTFNLWTWSLLTTQSTTISNNCSIPPSNYISSNINVATISGSLVTAIGSWSVSIYSSGGLCADSSWKNLIITNPTGTFNLSTWSLIKTQTSTIFDNCSIAPTSYISSNSNIATISWSVISAVWSWTITITESWGLCWSITWKTLTISDLVWTFNLWTGSLLTSQTTSISDNCSIAPISYISSNPNVATISGSLITSIWSWTTVISSTGGLCQSSSWKILTVSAPIWTFTLWTGSLIKSQTTSIFDNCSIAPISYISSNPNVATISGSLITAIWSWTTIISSTGWLCWDTTWKSLMIEELVWTFTLWTGSLLTSQSTSILNNCSISPISYISSNPSIASISGTTITTYWSWIVTITASWGLCENSSGKILEITNPIWTFSLWNNDLISSQNTIISNTCSISPTSYTSSNPNVATISGSVITTVWSWTTTITSNGWLCWDSSWKILTVRPLIWTFTLWTGSLIKTQSTSISDNCSISPSSYTSSNINVATISGTVITTVWSWTTTITANDWLCLNNNWKILTVIDPIGTFNIWTGSLIKTQTTSIFDNCSIAPTSYTSSNTNVATISGSIITAIWSWTTNITANNWLCLNNNWKQLSVSNPVWSFSLNVSSLYPTQNTIISDTCSISPISYISSNTNVATISGTTISAVWSWTVTITESWGLCLNSWWKTLTVNPIVWTFNIQTWSLIKTQTTSISDNCSISPTSYISSNTGVALISWTTITAVWSWTSIISPNWGLCANITWKQLTISNPNWSFNLWTESLIKTQTTSISNNCSISPTSYTSSNTSVAIISWTTITAVWSWITSITQNWWLCNDSNWKSIIVTNPVGSFNIDNQSLLSTQTTLISDNCSIAPTSYISSNTNVATISGSIITAVWSWTVTITESWGLCLDYSPKQLTIFNPVWSFNLSSNSVFSSQPVTISDNCSISPQYYTLSNTNIATISWTIITTIGSWTTMVIPHWGLCLNSDWKQLTINNPIGNFILWKNQLIVTQSTNISDNCSISPISYTSSNTRVITISWTTINAVWSWTSMISQNWWLCENSNWQSISVSDITGSFNLESNSIVEKQNTTILDNCSITPTSYISSNTNIATISWTTITAVRSWTTSISATGGLCFDYSPRQLTVTSLYWNNKTITLQLQTGGWMNLFSSGIALNITWPTWYFEALTDNSWSFTFSWVTNRNYNINLDSILKKKIDSSYVQTIYSPSVNSLSIYLDSNKTINILVKDITTSDYINLVWNINWLNWKTITVFRNSSNWTFKKDLWTLDSDFATYQIRVPKNIGLTTLWIQQTSSASWTITQDWQSPKPVNVNIENSDIQNLDFTISTNTKYNFTLYTKTNNNIPIPYVNVYVYSPSSNLSWINWVSDDNWMVSFTLSPGSYNYWWNLDWYSIPSQQTISINSNSTWSIIFKSKQYYIAGTVFYWDVPLKNVNISAYNIDTQTYINTQTDVDWSYKLFVDKWNWKLNWYDSNYWQLDSKLLTVSNNSLDWQNFIIANLHIVSWIVAIDSITWTWISQTNIYATPTDWNTSNWWQVMTDNNWQYVLSLKPWSYIINAYNSSYWFIWNNSITISDSNISNVNFLVLSPKTIYLSFTWSWIPDDLTNFEWAVDIFDTTNNIWFTKDLKWVNSYSFDKVPNWIYSVTVTVLGVWQVYNSWSFIVNDSKSIQIPLNKIIVPVNWIVYETWTLTPIDNAYIELKNLDTNQVIWTKSDSSGSYSISVPYWTNFEITAKNHGYLSSKTRTWTTTSSWASVILQMIPITNTINISWNIQSQDSSYTISNNLSYISLQWVDSLWNQTKQWYWQELTLSWSTFTLSNVPSNFGSGEIIVSVDWFAPYSTSIQQYWSHDMNIWIVYLQKVILSPPTTTTITPSQWWIIDYANSNVKIVIPNSSLGNWTQPWTLISRETTKVPSTSWYQMVWNSAQDITAFDSDWNPITTLNSAISIEFTESWSDLYDSNHLIKIQDIKNMQIYYFDATSSSWISLPTIVTSSNQTLFNDYRGSTLLSSISSYRSITFTLKANTTHLTMFTSLVSSIITSSDSTSSSNQSSPTTNNWWGWGGGWWYGWGIASTSLISWITNTANSLNSYFGNIEQSIVLQSWDTLNSVLAITRDGKQISVWDILAAAQNSVSNISKNAVSFAVWDIISSGNWTAEISLWWYTTVDLTRNSAVKIDSAWDWFLTFENVKWTWHYHFDKRDEWNFKYEIKWKVWYATIRGTTLEVSSDLIKDKYYLIEWKIDVYNSILDKTITMHSGDVYIAYANWDESFTASEQPKQSVTDVINKVIPIDKPIEQGISSSQDLSSQTQNTSNSDGIDFTASTPKTFTDVLPNNWFFAYITNLSNKWIVKWYSDWKFHPEKNITRAELMSMISKSVPLNYTFDSDFSYSDINPNDWWAPLVSTAKKLWYISQTQQKFRPKDRITRAEALKIILNFKQVDASYNPSFTYNDVNWTDWFAPYVSYSKQHWYISMTNILFRPNDPITRWEMSKMLYNILLK